MAMSTNSESSSISQLRKAAGSKSLETLQVAIEGWPSQELSTAGQEGKTPLHMAAWKGCLENVRYLVEHCHCDVNVYSRGEFSYGKTAIFFAATQSRVDVMEYLLSREARVTIVNNKGQSVLSIAASHDMPPSVMERIQQLEEIQGDGWWNFRATHSDGLEYGDLDPRFLDRPIRPDDVVTSLSINPTTKVTRKGGFARRNPTLAREQRERQQKQQQRKERRNENSTNLTEGEETQWERAWETLAECVAEDTNPVTDTAVTRMLDIVTLGNQYRRAWIPESADRLLDIFNEDISAVSSLIVKSKEQAAGDRTFDLLEKIHGRIWGSGKADTGTTSLVNLSCMSNNKTVIGDVIAWEKASQQVQDLSMRILEYNERTAGVDATILTLPEPPILIDTLDSLQKIFKELLSRINEATFEHPFLIAVDTEWYDALGDNGATHSELSTIQFAVIGQDTKQIFAHIVDLTISEPLYRKTAEEFVRCILCSKNLLVLGFALAHDLHMLESFAQDLMSEKNDDGATFLDIQLLMAQGRKAMLPGLKKCASRFSNVPLCKSEQCSEWGCRPLRKSQLEYAGLDAAILLVLLSEYYRNEAMMSAN
ncbi:ankyrin repeat domain protein [Nitzschia inconspicua]|uniref:Ankyrin repeat domain protein n=1 Tax=Nitzschia inconspicua TaxID=303405 RepID=A0A9K3PX68_9STRA|nr:ankyrin repeat domain protein [Nitzschia inconspicua]